ncbi:MAG TPA: hypothetical protein EYP14_05605, partial [Planctomycetaceae bacterium]|nr:hypothetical protein [Planctomycetaceae bacterium]
MPTFDCRDRRRSIRATVRIALLVIVSGGLVGCSARHTADLLEARLRHQEDELRRLQGRLEQKEAELAEARRETELLRSRLQASNSSLQSDQIALLAQVERLKINALLTGGIDRDGQPGDEALSVFLAPQDHQGDALKVPGTLRLTLYDLGQAGRETIGTWTFSPDQMRERWHRGVLGVGYQFELSWQEPPRSDELVLHAELILPDHRRFQATAPIR